MKNIIAAALLGALSLGTAGVAAADHDHDRDRDRDGYRDYDRYDDERVLDTRRLRRDRGRVVFDVTPGLRRDGLLLVTDGRVAISKIQFVYSDGRVATLKARRLARMPNDDGTLTIQTGRPPGLRHVRVWYRLAPRQRSAELSLVSFGDGYTDEEDLRDSERGEYRD